MGEIAAGMAWIIQRHCNYIAEYSTGSLKGCLVWSAWEDSLRHCFHFYFNFDLNFIFWYPLLIILQKLVMSSQACWSTRADSDAKT